LIEYTYTYTQNHKVTPPSINSHLTQSHRLAMAILAPTRSMTVLITADPIASFTLAFCPSVALVFCLIAPSNVTAGEWDIDHRYHVDNLTRLVLAMIVVVVVAVVVCDWTHSGGIGQHTINLETAMLWTARVLNGLMAVAVWVMVVIILAEKELMDGRFATTKETMHDAIMRHWKEEGDIMTNLLNFSCVVSAVALSLLAATIEGATVEILYICYHSVVGNYSQD
jgi:hypothetical protein